MSLQYGELGSLAAEISSLVWGTPANFRGFRVLAALLQGTLVVGPCQPNFAALNKGRHLYSALAQILVVGKIKSRTKDEKRIKRNGYFCRDKNIR